MLRLSRQAEEAIRRHAAEGYPLEICGLLIGTVEPDGRTAWTARPARNAWEKDPELRRGLLEALERAGGAASAADWDAATSGRRYLVDPLDQLHAMKEARRTGMDVVGVYHSHPDHPAIPSRFDRDAALPEWSYIIVSVRGGEVAELRSWVVEGEEEPFVEEAVAEE